MHSDVRRPRLWQLKHIISYFSEEVGVADMAAQLPATFGVSLRDRYPIYFRLIGRVPGGLVGGPRAYQDHFFRGFKSHRVHARRGFFLDKKIE